LSTIMRTLHVALAGFFAIPLVMYVVTGVLYTFEIKGQYQTAKTTVALDLPNSPSLADLESRVSGLLEIQHKMPPPTGGQSLKKIGNMWSFEWTGARHDAVLSSTDKPGEYLFEFKDTTWYRHFVQLHKAKAGFYFKLVAAGLSAALIFMFASGILMSYSSPALFRVMLYSFSIGTVVFILAAWLS